MVAQPEPEPIVVRVCLVGRQNAGKTSLLMHLTHSVQRPVNFPGTSVERAEARIRLGHITLVAVDLPGIGSLEAVSKDEQLALAYLQGEVPGQPRPDVVCAVLDASKLSIELHLLDKLSTLGLPLVVALTKLDVAHAEGREVDVDALQARLGVPVVSANALRGEGVDALRETLLDAVGEDPRGEIGLSPDAVAEEVTSEAADAGPSLTDRLDAVLIHRVFGLPILLALVYGVFQLIFTGAEPFMGAIESGQEALVGAVQANVEAGALQAFLVDGLINGVGSIVIFLPQIILLMLMVSLMEATGYMARAAYLLDRVLSGVGLSGRSFVPMVSSAACAVPGVLATRIIDNERDRIATIVVAPLMSCSARLPVYVILIGAFFPVHYGGLILLGIYLFGILTAALVALILRKTVLKGERSLLMMELPAYQRPSARVVFGQVWGAARDFMILAGTVIFATAIVIWLLSYYPRPAEIHTHFETERAHATQTIAEGEALDAEMTRLDAEEASAYLEQSYLAKMGKAIHPIFEPAGFDWRTSVGILAAFPARELIIPTLGILYAEPDADPGNYEVSAMGDLEEDGLRNRLLTAERNDGTRAFTPLIALGLMVFFLLCSQCVATLAAIERETRSWRWPLFTFTYMTVLAWVAAVLIYQVGSALGLGGA